MPTLIRLEGLRVLMYFNDHPLPHVRVRLSEGRECTVALATLRITGPVAAREIGDALRWIATNRRSLQQLWRDNAS